MDSICGEVLEVGNFDGVPGAIIKLSDGTKVRCETSEVLCRRVAKRLYEQLRLVGEWRRHPVGAPFYASDIDDTPSSVPETRS